MKYIAPDGTILISSPKKETTYECVCKNIADGIYESLETTSTDTPIGIQQIKITRTVSKNIMTISIIESTEQELQDYLISIKEEQK